MKPIGRVEGAAWTIKKAAEELERARERQDFQSQSVARESKREEGDIALVWPPVLARGDPAVSKERNGVSHIAESRMFS